MTFRYNNKIFFSNIDGPTVILKYRNHNEKNQIFLIILNLQKKLG